MNENPLPSDHPVSIIAAQCDGKIESAGACPDGSGFAIMSMPLPKDHWLTKEGYNVPPMPFRYGTEDGRRYFEFPTRESFAAGIRDATKYALRGATMNGKEMDLDPDALVKNMVVGMLGYWTPDGFCSDSWANPPSTQT